MVDFRFGRIDVLHLDPFGLATEYAATERHDFSRKGMYGEDDTPPETVAQAVVIRFITKSGFDEVLLFVSLAERLL